MSVKPRGFPAAHDLEQRQVAITGPRILSPVFHIVHYRCFRVMQLLARRVAHVAIALAHALWSVLAPHTKVIASVLLLTSFIGSIYYVFFQIWASASLKLDTALPYSSPPVLANLVHNPTCYFLTSFTKMLILFLLPFALSSTRRAAVPLTVVFWIPCVPTLHCASEPYKHQL